MYDRLEDCLEKSDEEAQKEIDTIIAQLRIRSGSYGIERKNLVNNLFKSIIDLSFPNIVKYFFWASDNNLGIFEQMKEEDYLRFKRMSKYKKEEVYHEKTGAEEQSNSQDFQYENINHLLEISLE